MPSPLAAKLLRFAGWTAAGLLAVAFGFYLLLLAINWRDRPPSQAALRMAALHRDRPPVSDGANAFVFAHGFGVAQDDDPRAAGLRRLAWLQRNSGPGEQAWGEDPAPDHMAFSSSRPERIKALTEACRATAECVAMFEGDAAVLREWLDSEAWLLQRYQALLGHEGWLETVPFDERAALPSYSLVLDGQRLLMLQALVHARAGDAAGVNDLLARDARFWRMVLASSDVLITKMMATAALLRTFKTGNLVLRELPAGKAIEGMPEEWQVPLGREERSLLRALVGEWVYVGSVTGRLEREQFATEDAGLWSKLVARAARPLFQPQDSLNRRAEELLGVAAQLDVPMEQYPEAIDRATASLEPEGILPVRSLYNPVGDLLLAISSSYFAPYGARVADLEGVRRAAVLATTLRAQAVPAADVPGQLRSIGMMDPYTGLPFEWDAAAPAIVFNGIERSGRSRHALRY